MELSFDGRLDYKGYGGCYSHCRLLVYSQHYRYLGGDEVVAVLVEEADNQGTSIVNVAEHLARLVHERVGRPRFFTVVEYCPLLSGLSGTFCRLALPDPDRSGNLPEVELAAGEVGFIPMTQVEVEEMVDTRLPLDLYSPLDLARYACSRGVLPVNDTLAAGDITLRLRVDPAELVVSDGSSRAVFRDAVSWYNKTELELGRQAVQALVQRLGDQPQRSH